MIYKCFIAVLLALPLIASADPVPQHRQLGLSEHEVKALQMFDDFTLKFNRRYESKEEFEKRFSIFKTNLKKIDRLNKEERGSAQYGVTKFADLTFEEFIRNKTGGRIPPEEIKRHQDAIKDLSREEIVFTDEFDDEEEESDLGEDDGITNENIKVVDGKVYLPKRFDYRKKKAVTPVKDQGECGSCWAFSFIANVEGVAAKKFKKLLDLSEQEFVDCDNLNKGCNGGWMRRATKEAIRLGGIASTADYPYKGYRDMCRFTKKMVKVVIRGDNSVDEDEKQMAKEIVSTGPLSVAVAVPDSFQFYEKGIFDPTPSQCSRSEFDVNHGVAIVGYGVGKVDKQKVDFWIIKNSWGADWGEKGYIRLSRGKRSCAVHSFASSVLI